MRTIHEQPKTDPVLADSVILDLNAALRALPWLHQPLGRAWPIDRGASGKKIWEPCIYTSGNSYETIVPSADLGNHSFFLLKDAQRVADDTGQVRTPYWWILWCDLRTVFSSPDRRDTENVKAAVLSIFRNAIVRHGSITVERVFEEPQNVYKGLTLDESENRYLTHPYAGLRLEGTITSRYEC